MKIFKLDEKYLAIIGVLRLPPGQGSVLNYRNVCCISMYVFYAILSFCFICFDAKTPVDYGQGGFALLSLVFLGTGYTINTLDARKVFAFIDQLQKVIDNRK